MKLIAEAGTDVAAVVLFDPLALPGDFDERYRQETIEVANELESQGRFFYGETGADGAYLLHLFVDENVPEELERYCVDAIEFESFHVPSGQLWFTGSEYAFRLDDSQLKKYPNMGTVVEIPIGTYKARFTRTEYPEEYVEENLNNGLTAEQRRFKQNSTNLSCVGCFATILTVIALCFWAFVPLAWLLVPLLIIYWIYVSRRSRSPLSLAAKEKMQTVERNYPSIVAEFRSVSNQ